MPIPQARLLYNKCHYLKATLLRFFPYISVQAKFQVQSSRSRLAQLRLRGRGRTALDTLAARDCLLSLSDIVKVRSNGLASMLLSLGSRTTLDGLCLASQLVLRMRNAGDGVRVESAGRTRRGVLLLLLRLIVGGGLLGFLGSLGSLTDDEGSWTTGDGAAVVSDVLFAFGDIGNSLWVIGKALFGVLLGLGCRAALDRLRFASELVFLLGDVGDGLRVESMLVHCGYRGVKMTRILCVS